jgi:hypothetical protein
VSSVKINKKEAIILMVGNELKRISKDGSTYAYR